MHSVSVIFIGRKGGADDKVTTSLNTAFIPPLEFDASSTMIREAFIGQGDKQNLALLPYTIYQDIVEQNIYLPKTSPSKEDNFLPQTSS